MRRSLLVTVLIVAGIVAAFIVAEKQLRARFGFAEGLNGVTVEQADGPEGRIVAIRSRFIDETARYSPEGKLLSRELKATLRDDSKKVVTFLILIEGNKVLGTERYEFNKRALKRTWARYNVAGVLLYTREEMLASDHSVWRLADGTPTTPAGARAVAVDKTAIEIGPRGATPGLDAMPNGVVVQWRDAVDSQTGPAWSIQSRYVREDVTLGKNGTLLSRDEIATLRNDDRSLVTFKVHIAQDKVVGTALSEVDKKGPSHRQVFDASGVLLYVEERAPNGKTSYADPQGKPLTQQETADLSANAADEEGIDIPVPQSVTP